MKGYFLEIERAISKHAAGRYETRISSRDDVFVLYADPEPLCLHFLVVAFIFGPLGGMFYQGISVMTVVVSVLWLMIFLPEHLNLMRSDLEATFGQNTGIVIVKNINPFVLFLRKKLGLPVKFSWEGRHELSSFARVDVREVRHTKFFPSHFRLCLVQTEDFAVPFAEFRSEPLARHVADVVQKMAKGAKL